MDILLRRLPFLAKILGLGLLVMRLALAEVPDPMDFEILGLDPEEITPQNPKAAELVHAAYLSRSREFRGNAVELRRVEVAYLHFRSELAFRYLTIRDIRKLDPQVLLRESWEMKDAEERAANSNPSHLYALLEYQQDYIRALDSDWYTKAPVVAAFSENIRLHSAVYLDLTAKNPPRLGELIRAGVVLDASTQTWFWKLMETKVTDQALQIIFRNFGMKKWESGLAMALRMFRVDHGTVLPDVWFSAAFMVLNESEVGGVFSPSADTMRILYMLKEGAVHQPEALATVLTLLEWSKMALIAPSPDGLNSLSQPSGRLERAVIAADEKFELYLCMKSSKPFDASLLPEISLN